MIGDTTPIKVEKPDDYSQDELVSHLMQLQSQHDEEDVKLENTGAIDSTDAVRLGPSVLQLAELFGGARRGQTSPASSVQNHHAIEPGDDSYGFSNGAASLVAPDNSEESGITSWICNVPSSEASTPNESILQESAIDNSGATLSVIKREADHSRAIGDVVEGTAGIEDYPSFPVQDSVLEQDQENSIVAHDNIGAEDQLDQFVGRATGVLDAIRSTIAAASLGGGLDRRSIWLEQADKLRKRAIRSQTIIAVVGNTGAGKSSLINALLEQKSLLPTNCMRACTAAVTEISYNHEDDYFRADIEFLTRTEWERELDILLYDLFDENGNVRRTVDPNTEAGVAWARIKAVYPEVTREELAAEGGNLRGLIKFLCDKPICRVLDKPLKIRHSDVNYFYRELAKYADSKDKSGTDETKKKKRSKVKEDKHEYWPLIKIIKVRLRARALSTGAVIVDLPGVQDSNAARAAIAKQYMKNCNALWIVAPITRAVDDKTAKDLLGESFKRQLLMDGHYSAVTFICTKTDDIVPSEAILALDLDEDVEEIELEIEEIQVEMSRLTEQFEAAKKQGERLKKREDFARKQIHEWQGRLIAKQFGEDYVPEESETTKKRKRPEAGNKGNKRNKRAIVDSVSDWNANEVEVVSDGSEDESSDGSADNEDEDSFDTTETTQIEMPKSEEEIKAILEEKHRDVKAAADELEALKLQISAINSEMHDYKDKIRALERQKKSICAAARNRYSKNAIRTDFRTGLQELDEEMAEADDPENFDPSVQMRDYDAIELPVFTVSTADYLKLTGKRDKDGEPDTFIDAVDTEIPALQQHAMQLAEASRHAHIRPFLDGIGRFLREMKVYLEDDRVATGALCAAMKKAIDKNLASLDLSMKLAIRELMHTVDALFEREIYSRLQRGAEAAEEAAPRTVAGWGSKAARKADRQEGVAYRYPWSTYKAICRREGEYSSSTYGVINFNQQLADPMLAVITTNWDRIMNQKILELLAIYEDRHAQKCFEEFAVSLTKELAPYGVSEARLDALKTHSAEGFKSRWSACIATAGEVVQKIQRETSRVISPHVQEQMTKGYELCVEERGPGSFMRMKGHMADHIENISPRMFREAKDHIVEQLTSLSQEVAMLLLKEAKSIIAWLDRVYGTLLEGNEMVDAEGRKALLEAVIIAQNQLDGIGRMIQLSAN